MGNNKPVYKEDGFNVAAEVLWRSELITTHCESCKGRQKCFKPFLSSKTLEGTLSQIDKIRVCKIRLKNLGF